MNRLYLPKFVQILVERKIDPFLLKICGCNGEFLNLFFEISSAQPYALNATLFIKNVNAIPFKNIINYLESYKSHLQNISINEIFYDKNTTLNDFRVFKSFLTFSLKKFRIPNLIFRIKDGLTKQELEKEISENFYLIFSKNNEFLSNLEELTITSNKGFYFKHFQGVLETCNNLLSLNLIDVRLSIIMNERFSICITSLKNLTKLKINSIVAVKNTDLLLKNLTSLKSLSISFDYSFLKYDYSNLHNFCEGSMIEKIKLKILVDIEKNKSTNIPQMLLLFKNLKKITFVLQADTETESLSMFGDALNKSNLNSIVFKNFTDYGANYGPRLPLLLNIDSNISKIKLVANDIHVVTNRFIKHFSKFKNLTKLSLTKGTCVVDLLLINRQDENYNDDDDDDVDGVELLHLTNLTFLDCSHNRFSKKTRKFLFKLIKNSSLLKTLILKDCGLNTQKLIKLIEILKRKDNLKQKIILEELDFSFNDLSFQFIKDFSQFPSGNLFFGLKRIDFSFNLFQPSIPNTTKFIVARISRREFPFYHQSTKNIILIFFLLLKVKFEKYFKVPKPVCDIILSHLYSWLPFQEPNNQRKKTKRKYHFD